MQSPPATCSPWVFPRGKRSNNHTVFLTSLWSTGGPSGLGQWDPSRLGCPCLPAAGGAPVGLPIRMPPAVCVCGRWQAVGRAAGATRHPGGWLSRASSGAGRGPRAAGEDSPPRGASIAQVSALPRRLPRWPKRDTGQPGFQASRKIHPFDGKSGRTHCEGCGFRGGRDHLHDISR